MSDPAGQATDSRTPASPTPIASAPPHHHHLPADTDRRTVISVGSGDVARQIADGLNGHGSAIEVVPAANYLAALAVAGGRSNVHAVLGPIDCPPRLMPRVVRSLRELAPQARLYVRVPEGREDDAADALAIGFDGYVLEPLTTDEIRCLASVGAQATRHAAHAPARPDDTTHAGPQETDHPLGDTDLVEAVLRGRFEATRLACRLIEQQGGPTGVAVARDESSIPTGHAGVPLTRADGQLGWLHAPQTTDHDLAPWADWLATWVTLDRKFSGLRRLALTDELTRAWNRRYFDRFLARVIDHARHDRSQVTLLVYDIDDFKVYNDRYGHAAGDEILCEVARLMRSVVREHDVVARIGGDEFAVIFWDAEPPRTENPAAAKHPTDVLDCAKRFQAAVCRHEFPKLLDEQPGTLTISGGLASFPWDGRTPTELLARADAMALRSKRQGKNAITLGPGALNRCERSG